MIQHHRTRRGMVAAATSILLALAGASAAHAAATVTVTGDTGTPQPVTPGTTIRNMSPQIGLAFPTSDGWFNATFTGPDGTAVSTQMSCYNYDNWNRTPDFRGNGNYTVTITNFAKADNNCATPTSTETFTYTVNSSVSITPPAGPFLTRTPNSFKSNTLSLPVQGNPGAGGNDVQYALNAVLAPDGSISNAPQTGYVNPATNTIDLNFTVPGTYTVVMRATNGTFGSPWSAPVKVQAMVPFDMSGLSFPDSIGPKYQLRGTINEKAIQGKVSLAIARGKKSGGKYKSLGKVKISTKGTFTKRFTQHKTGWYRVRVHYAGSAVAPAASIVFPIKITRHIYFR